jgi:predicted transposase/invertase (TIGR01784 family)
MRADRALARISRDQQKWARAFSREVGIIDHESGLYAARKAGEEKAHMEIARNLKAMGDTSEKIAAATGLSPEEIEKL